MAEEFPYVSVNDLPRLPLNREIAFSINLVLGVQLVSITPYRIAPAELKKSGK